MHGVTASRASAHASLQQRWVLRWWPSAWKEVCALTVEEVLDWLRPFPHRGTGTREERLAAETLQKRLEARGWHVELETFRCPAATLYEGPAVVALGIALGAGVAAAGWPTVGAFIALVALLPLVGELLALPFNLDRLTVHWRGSQNLLALPQEGGEIRLLLAAHIDSQRGTLFFHPRVRRHTRAIFTTCYAFFFGVPLLLLVGSFHSLGGTTDRLAALAMLLLGAFFFLVGVFGRPVPGANDNASGVALAVLLAEDVRRQWPAAPLALLLTGAEEVGARGMYHFLRRHPANPPPVLVNIDNVAGGRLSYLRGEGLLVPFPYDRRLIALAQAVAAEGNELVLGRPLLLPTDAEWHAARGWPAISFVGQEADGSIPHYHWYDDTWEHLSVEVLEERRRVIFRFLAKLLGEHQEMRDDER